MKVMERNVMRLAAVQHLRAAFGIKTKNWNKNKGSGSKLTANVCHSVKVFGVPLEHLPQSSVEYGSVPSFLVEACTSLKEHVETEGLFRKSGSIVRLKALRAKLDTGEECLSTALPCDVAGLVKQFFRELPEPVVPTELHEAFLKAQQLPSGEERTSATLLLSCVLPDRNLSILRYFFNFLQDVSQRSAANKMDSSNLSVILAPNLLHSGDGTEKMNASTEKRLKLQAAVVHCLIENAKDFGAVPGFLMEKVPAMLGCEPGLLSPSQDGLEELDLNSGMKRRRRRSLGVFSSATPVIMTPNSKRKLPLESGHSYGFSNKKRRSIKKSLGMELLPNALFGGSSTPGSGYLDPSGSALDSSQNTLASAGGASKQAASSARRKSRRLSHRHAVSRVESGKTGCFSPKVTKKEAVRKSLRLRFSLGKSSRDPGSETIGWRLATQESTTSFLLTKDTEFSPAVLRDKIASKGSKFISKSEDNLLTPQCDVSVHQTSWSGETPEGAMVFSGGSFTDTPMSMCLKNNNYYSSEPAIVTAKPPVAASLPKKLCCASSAESLESEGSFTESQAKTGPTLLKIKRAFTESGSDLPAVLHDHSAPAGETKPQPPKNIRSPGSMRPPLQPYTPKIVVLKKEKASFPTPQRCLAEDQNITFGQIEIVPLSPLHIDSALFETGVCGSPVEKAADGSLFPRTGLSNSIVEETEGEQVNCSRLIDALDIQSPAHFQLGVSSGVQSTPYRASRLGLPNDLNTPLPSATALHTTVHDAENLTSPDNGTHVQKQEPQSSPGTLENRRLRVAEHIQRFNKLTLYSPRAQAAMIRSPLKFQRTPVRQSVRRINSLLGDRRLAKASPVVKAASLESGLSSGSQLQPYVDEEPGVSVPRDDVRPTKIRPPIPPKKPSSMVRKSKLGALGDVTNKVQAKTRGDTAPAGRTGPGAAQRSVVQQLVEQDVCRYRGSPRNPLNEGRLLSATKPIDL